MFVCMPLPSSVLWKVYRAKTHFAELQTEVHRYFETNPGKVVREVGGNPDEYVGNFQPDGPVPGRVSIIMGDCIQNLRSSLDYLVWELVLAAKNTPERLNMFPICSTQEFFEQQLARHRLDGVAADAIEEIKSLQPYHHGNDFDKAVLWVIDDLCNINKHRRVLLTDLFGGPSDIELQSIGGELFGRVTRIKKNAKIGPYPIVDGPKGRGVQVDVDPKIAAIIAINEGTAQNVEITLFLAEMLKYVELTVLPRFERFFI